MLKKVIKEIKSWGVDVELDAEDNFFDPEEDLIGINTRCSKQEQLFSLLHEAGHAIIHLDEEYYEENYPAKCNPKSSSSIDYANEVMKEEIEAWDQGWMLAESLNLNINKENYYALATECLEAYEHAVRNSEIFNFWNIFRREDDE
jgi:hypothetical protein